ncbi:hypothetical protein P7C71_g3291, partial [Lecanoromycetidae sp. Uapishka_2]
MAQKAAKQLAARNSAVLNRVHLISLGNNLVFLLLRLLVFRAKYTRNTLILYIVFSMPALGIEYWFETIGRPKYAENGELKKSGEDLEAKGLTEFMWDVLYWTWACIAAAALLGNGAWYMYAAVPIYSMWMASTVLLGMRNGMAGMGKQDPGSAEGTGGEDSKRQKKLEKRGGQKMQYR